MGRHDKKIQSLIPRDGSMNLEDPSLTAEADARVGNKYGYLDAAGRSWRPEKIQNLPWLSLSLPIKDLCRSCGMQQECREYLPRLVDKGHHVPSERVLRMARCRIHCSLFTSPCDRMRGGHVVTWSST